jgi:hypothetical protein
MDNDEIDQRRQKTLDWTRPEPDVLSPQDNNVPGSQVNSVKGMEISELLEIVQLILGTESSTAATMIMTAANPDAKPYSNRLPSIAWTHV